MAYAHLRRQLHREGTTEAWRSFALRRSLSSLSSLHAFPMYCPPVLRMMHLLRITGEVHDTHNRRRCIVCWSVLSSSSCTSLKHRTKPAWTSPTEIKPSCRPLQNIQRCHWTNVVVVMQKKQRQNGETRPNQAKQNTTKNPTQPKTTTTRSLCSEWNKWDGVHTEQVKHELRGKQLGRLRGPRGRT